jgi:5-methylcytosine-specific restriction endonuclease McrA
MSKAARLKELVARTDARFRLDRGWWVGPCIFCGGRLAFDPATGDGATLEHIRPRSDGGTDDLANLALAHARCNNEKGRRTDSKRRRQRDPERYERIVAQLLAQRAEHFRPPDSPAR